MSALGVGVVLHPDAEYLELCRPIIEDDADFFEVVPETFWRVTEDGTLEWNPWADVLEQIQAVSGKPLLAHGLGYSPGSVPADAGQDDRAARWLAHMRRDCERFGYQWYTEHLGWMSYAGRELFLPLPLPPTDEAAQTVARRLGRIKAFAGTVGFENQVGYFNHSDVAAEPVFWNRICEIGDLVLLLDMHNAWTQCVNAGIEIDVYLEQLDTSRVIEIHLSGGSESDAGWLESGRVLRLDSHDGPVPEPVWEAYERVLPRCPNLRAVVVERLDGTLGDGDVDLLREEVRRAQRIFGKSGC